MFILFEPVCFRCGSRERLNVHHKNYKNLGNETDKDLVVLCENCHKKLHQIAEILECGIEIATIVFLRVCRRTKTGRPIGISASRKIVFRNNGRCRKCGDKLELIEPRRNHFKPKQKYYFTHYWYCGGCETMFMDNNFKKEIITN